MKGKELWELWKIGKERKSETEKEEKKWKKRRDWYGVMVKFCVSGKNGWMERLVKVSYKRLEKRQREG